MKSTQNLPTKLKELRKQNHYSQEYVAEQLNISRQAISHWENGRAYPDIDNLVLLAELYGVSVDELLDNHVNVHDGDEAVVISTVDNSQVMETIGLASVLALSLNFPFGGIIASIFIICWMKYTKRKNYIIYAICILCFLLSFYDSYVFISHISLHGQQIIKWIE